MNDNSTNYDDDAREITLAECEMEMARADAAHEVEWASYVHQMTGIFDAVVLRGRSVRDHARLIGIPAPVIADALRYLIERAELSLSWHDDIVPTAASTSIAQ